MSYLFERASVKYLLILIISHLKRMPFFKLQTSSPGGYTGSMSGRIKNGMMYSKIRCCTMNSIYKK